jgi:hypothetical protein
MQFGRISADQLLLVMQWMPAVDAVEAEIRESMASNPGRIAELAPKGFRWSSMYELPIEEHLARLLILQGKAQFVVEASKSGDPAGVVLEELEASDDGGDLEMGVFGEAHTFAYFVGLIFALVRSFEAVAVFGRYINELIAEAKSASPKRDSALLDAIRIDATVVSGPTAARRISTAYAFGDDAFLHELRLAMNGKTGDQAVYLRKFKRAIKLLAESGALHGSATSLARRLVELGIYPKGYTAVKNAAELIRKAQILYVI